MQRDDLDTRRAAPHGLVAAEDSPWNSIDLSDPCWSRHEILKGLSQSKRLQPSVSI